MQQGKRTALRHLAIAAAMALAGSLLASPSSARERGHNGDNAALVDHAGIYLAQQIGKCLNHTGPCYFGGQCPGGEERLYAYATGRVYCENFYPPRPYPPTFFESLLGVR
jgi:hypothetical protein